MHPDTLTEPDCPSSEGIMTSLNIKSFLCYLKLIVWLSMTDLTLKNEENQDSVHIFIIIIFCFQSPFCHSVISPVSLTDGFVCLHMAVCVMTFYEHFLGVPLCKAEPAASSFQLGRYLYSPVYEHGHEYDGGYS